MSLLNQIIGGILQPSWLEDYLPASFRGVPFFVERHTAPIGRRLAVHEFPGRDDAHIEDMGAKLGRYSLSAYILGDDYGPQRDALRAALKQPGPGTLVHPYYGVLRVYVEDARPGEQASAGGRADFELELIAAGIPSSPVIIVDTASQLLKRSLDAYRAVTSAFARGFSLASAPDFILAAGQQAFSLFGGSFSGLLADAGLTTSSFSGFLGPITGALGAIPIDALTLAGFVTGGFAQFAEQIGSGPSSSANASIGSWSPGDLDTVNSASVSSAEYTVMSRAAPPPADPSFGLLAFQDWQAYLPASITPATPNRQWLNANAAAISVLVQSSALIATASVYSATTFEDSNAALAARDVLLALIDAQILAASVAGSDDAVAALSGLYDGVAADLTARAAQLPALGTYTVPEPIPSLVLAQRLYQDPTQADQLVTLNDVAHPAFMPYQGQALNV